jgi:hypothetical protein
MKHPASSTVRLLAAIALCALVSCAQTNRGGIAGTVFEPSGAAIPSAAVKVTNIGTNQTITLTASSEGRYSANLLEGTRTTSRRKGS